MEVEDQKGRGAACGLLRLICGPLSYNAIIEPANSSLFIRIAQAVYFVSSTAKSRKCNYISKRYREGWYNNHGRAVRTAPILLLIYGTLHPDRAPRDRQVPRGLKPVAAATGGNIPAPVIHFAHSAPSSRACYDLAWIVCGFSSAGRTVSTVTLRSAGVTTRPSSSCSR